MHSALHTKSIAKNVLFVHYGDSWIRGSERCLINLLTHINRTHYNPVLWCNNELLAETIRELNIDVYVTSFPLLFGEYSPIYNFHGYSKLVSQGLSIVDKHDIALIHSNSGAPSQWLNLVSRSRKLPLVLHLHSRYPLRDRITLGLYHVSKIVGVSQPVIDQLLDDGIGVERCQVIPNGIDTEALLAQPIRDLRSMLLLPSDAFVAVSICSLITRKGIDLLIDACRQLREICLPIHLVVIGEGPEHESLNTQVRNENLEHHVHLIGEQHNVVGLMRGGTDLYVSGAREEVFGLTLAEAGLSRLPVIAPSTGGIPSVVSHQRTGLLVPEEDSHAIAQAMFHLFINKTQRIEMGENGYNHVMSHFTIQSHTTKFERLYKTLISDPSMLLKWHSHWQILPPLQASFNFVKRRLRKHLRSQVSSVKQNHITQNKSMLSTLALFYHLSLPKKAS
ncbi:glycosyltransferase family 4 protein [Candidatus Enterovibrio escicola]|uniref:Glycosyltransferase SypI n=2 Tax=Candidatus Enterovibrio escicola TaxID=1927127 RepID=A0A2A5T1K5_9GAMM|nr:glycosyltransferase family 4 protein [Candidatus Enterovibrio escacola]PCS22043.1 Glycosyltransferase SypI [Candidatus Enterovibrio escacola]